MMFIIPQLFRKQLFILLVQLFRKSSKMPVKFVKPLKKGSRSVQREDIEVCRSPPACVGGSKRIKSWLAFPVNLAKFSCE